MTTPDTPGTIIVKDLAWIKAHLILLAAVVLLSGGIVYSIETLIAKHDAAREAKDQQIENLIIAQTTDLKARLAQDEQASAVRDAQYNQIITTLSGTIAKQSAQLQKQIAVNATLTAAQTAQAISQKTGANPGEVTAVGDNVTMVLPVARTINTDLDKLSTTQLQLDETQKQLTAQNGLTTDALLDYVNAKKVIASQDSQLKAADKVCTDKIDTLKAKNRKTNLKYMLAGGFIVEAVKLYFTHSL